MKYQGSETMATHILRMVGVILIKFVCGKPTLYLAGSYNVIIVQFGEGTIKLCICEIVFFLLLPWHVAFLCAQHNTVCLDLMNN